MSNKQMKKEIDDQFEAVVNALGDITEKMDVLESLLRGQGEIREVRRGYQKLKGLLAKNQNHCTELIHENSMLKEELRIYKEREEGL